MPDRTDSHWQCSTCGEMAPRTQLQCCEGNTTPWREVKEKPKPSKPKIDPDDLLPDIKYAALEEPDGHNLFEVAVSTYCLALIDAARELAKSYRAEMENDECIDHMPLLALEALLPKENKDA